MPVKRRRRVSPQPGSAQSSSSKSTPSNAPWGWVGTEVQDAGDITHEHALRTCGLSRANNHPFCTNKHVARGPPAQSQPLGFPNNNEVAQDEIIDISDDEQLCTKAGCKSNPYCLNYSGQEKWDDEGKCKKLFSKLSVEENIPEDDSRNLDLPVGLKNLGATCYANASLQVWFRDLVFRNGVYRCCPPGDADAFKESPVFQLQVTFAALQASVESVFNPTKLVESLKLNTTEQQDAQEFSKLFLSHLDAEFKRQSQPEMQSLITNQFEGQQVYGTICDHCHAKSERASGFLELEISFDANARLEECVQTLLRTEKLTGDNQYYCSRCEALRDATRYTELRTLPPVLHFSLLRFVYDLTTMARKKVKHIVTFPSVLDMSPYVGPDDARSAADPRQKEQIIYELRGILLHKGSTAYYGHYEAQIYDSVMDSWYQFNDETVTKVTQLGDPILNGKAPNGAGPKPRAQKGNVARKRRVVQDSDDEDPAALQQAGKEEAALEQFDIQSKDAYMLVYTRRASNSIKSLPEPPIAALEVVKSLNTSHEQRCNEYASRQELLKQKFDHLRQQVIAIYRSWEVKSVDEPCVVLSQRALESWLTKECIDITFPKSSEEPNGLSESGQGHGRSISVEEILCDHGRLDPAKGASMKCITKSAATAISESTNCIFTPELVPDDVCSLCVETMFTERLYEQEHPKFVQAFDQVADVEGDDPGFWISKPWVRDWKLLRPRMHTHSQEDPAPDSGEFLGHVQCEHGGLSLNTAHRRRISQAGAALLQQLFPLWTPLPTDTQPCVICEVMLYSSKEDRREIRKRAEDEKAQFRNLLDNASTGLLAVELNKPSALISTDFYKSWKRWVTRPTEVSRPETIDNSAFLCEHSLLAFDPNHAPDLANFIVINQEEWDALTILYTGGPLISVEKRVDGVNLHKTRLMHDLAVCDTCNYKRLFDWEITEITVRLWGDKDPLAPPVDEPVRGKAIKSYSHKKGSRQSKRLREIKALGEQRKITVTRSSTVKDVKVILQEELDVPTISQRIYFRGAELTDNSTTMSALQVAAHDTFDMKEEKEVHELDDDSDEDIPPSKRLKEAERGFSGTLLGGGGEVPQSSSRGRTPSSELITGKGKSCPACTFINEIGMETCSICSSLLD
ncbi:cysteine proteinase [Pluteus cervinus]|uniref:Cysteine proteinase n=1 Tax=Pluteus cervinus TaxID=181527 RepID=A0ACD3BDS3_9AGAR|nr:cysteine proteinase [Pluteus cervinus]